MDQNFIDLIKSKINTFEIIQKFSDLDLKKEGVNYKACCPFHGEKTASFIVSPQKDRFKCFGCGASGDGISFLMQYSNLTFFDAVKALAKHLSVDIPGGGEAIDLKIIHDKVIHEKTLTNEEIKALEEEQKKKIQYQVFHLKKNQGSNAAAYLQSRGLVITKLPKNSFYEAAPYKSETTGLEFPSAIAFLDSSETFINKRFIGTLPEGVGKSRNTGSMTNKIYDKTFKSEAKSVFLTEGVINALSIYQHDRSALATFATSNEFNDPEVLKKYLSGKNIHLAFDNDYAGLVYIVKFARFLFANEQIIGFKKIYAVIFPENKDANDCLQENTLENILADRFYHILLDKAFIEEEYLKISDKKYKPVFEYRNLFNHDRAKEQIINLGFCFITDRFETETFEGKNTIGFNPKYPESILPLKKDTKNLIFSGSIPKLMDINSEPEIYKAFKQFTAYGFNLKVISKQAWEDENGQTSEIGFIQFYIDQLASCVSVGDTVAKTEAVKRAAEFLAMLDNETYIVEYSNVYKKFKLNKGDWNQIASQYLSREKHKQIYSAINTDEGINIAEITDPHNLPGYVDINDFYRKGYFAAQNKEGKEVLYMFRSKEDGLFVASNFAMKMIGHLYHNEKSKNKRIVKLTDETGNDYYIEVESSIIRSFNDFSNRIYEESNLFFFGSKKQYEILLKNVSNNIPKWIELEILGQTKDDFFAFADGIYDYRNKVFKPIDELGTVTHKNITYYMPVFSSIYATLNGNSDQFSSAKYLKYEKFKKGEFDHTSFYEWTDLMNKVYPEDNTGKFAVIFVIMSAFREFIFHQHRRFPLFFLSGPTNSGKSQVADSIQSPFAQGMQIYNLNSGTDAAFFVSLEKYRNVPMIFDEYNDVQISKIKFQGLKAGYDGVGKQKKKDITSKELDMSEVNCSIVYLGQEIPEQDDYALFNRSFTFFIPLKDYNPEDTLIFDDLKKREEKGLTNILVEILNHRHIIEKNYYKTQLIIKDKLKKELQQMGVRFVERLLNSASEFITIFKIFKEHSSLKFAFDYESLYQAATEKCIKLSEMVQTANRLATFFSTISFLYNTGKIVKGREFKIEDRNKITIRRQQETETITLGGSKKVIFLRINLIFPHYKELQKNESLKTSLLSTYLADSPAYLGNAVNEEFEWFERKIIEKVNEVTNSKWKTEEYVSSKVRNTTAIALDYDKLDLELEKFSEHDGNETTTSDTPQEFRQKDEIPF